MNKPNKQQQAIHARLRRQVGQVSRNVRSATSKAWNPVKQIADEVQNQTNERIAKARQRQRRINQAKQQQSQHSNTTDFEDMNEMSRFFQSATKSLVQSKKQYESLVSILSQKPKAAEEAAEQGPEEMKALFATLSSMLRGTPEPNQQKNDESGSNPSTDSNPN